MEKKYNFRKTLILFALIILLPILIILAVLPNAQSNGLIPNSPTPAENDIRNRWLNSTVCAPPCWEGIKPGQPASLALENLKNNDFVATVELYEDRNTNIGEIAWSWAGNPQSGGRLFFHIEKDTHDGDIYAIWPEIGCCEDLEKVIKSFGEPNYTYIRRVENFESPTPQIFLNYTLVWIDKGFLIKGFPTEGTKVNQKFKVDTVVFFYPSWDGFLDFQGNPHGSAIPWHGYDEGTNYLIP